MTKSEIINRLSLFNFVLFFVGFDLFTSLISIFIPEIAIQSQIYTIPYRAFTLGLSLIIILITIHKKINSNFGFSLLVFYLIAFTIRLLYDYMIRTDINLIHDQKIQILLLYFQMLITVVSIAKSYKYIDLANAFKWIYLGFSIVILINYFTVHEFSLNTRIEDHQVAAGVRNTINTGYLAATYLLMSVFFYKKEDFPKYLKMASVPVTLLATIILLRTGSRGPLLSVFVAITLYLVLQKRNILLVIMTSFVFILAYIFFFNDILKAISHISPVMTNRIQYTIDSGGQETRTLFFAKGIEAFFHNPIFGSQAMLYRNGQFATYPHQLIIEAFMATGILGGASMLIIFYLLIKKVILNLKNHIKNYWVELILIIYIVRGMTAGSMFGMDYPIIFTFYFLVRSNKLNSPKNYQVKFRKSIYAQNLPSNISSSN